jgi:hypothetical protein
MHSPIFILDLPTNIELWNLQLLIFLREIGLFLVCLTVEKNAVMHENYRFMMDYEYQEKNKDIY